MTVQRAKIVTGIVAGLLAAVFLMPVALSTRGQSRKAGLSWPKKVGAYVAKSSETIPAFPRALSGYRSENNIDFWGNPFDSRGTLRIFDGNGWAGIPDFPNTMNACSAGVFMIRWRAAHPGFRIASTQGFNETALTSAVKIGNFGYMYGSNCEEPMFKFARTVSRNESTLVDIYYEVKFWQAAP
ncbi:MAG: hypothetical protein LC776_01205 [Acidobacteria bacterium]|nr:hypothetical protein [Acidobacteriota bacterium]